MADELVDKKATKEQCFATKFRKPAGPNGKGKGKKGVGKGKTGKKGKGKFVGDRYATPKGGKKKGQGKKSGFGVAALGKAKNGYSKSSRPKGFGKQSGSYEHKAFINMLCESDDIYRIGTLAATKKRRGGRA